MKNLIKIIATMTMLGTMTACGASGVLDDLSKVVDDALEAVRKATATQQIEIEAREEFVSNLDPNLTPEERAEAIQAEADRRANLSKDEQAAFEREVQERVEYLKTVEGLSQERRDANLRECQADDTGDGCAIVLLTFCTATPFDSNCISNIAYDIARTPLCIADKTTNDCTGTIARVCVGDPLYDFCDNADYFVARDNACWIQGRDGGTRTTECQQIVDTNRLQVNAELACRANYVKDTTENGNNTRCSNAVIAVCDLNPFDSFCQNNLNYIIARPGRITACRTEVPNAEFCDHAKTFVCDTNPFDVICFLDYGTNTYASERQTAIMDCQTTFVAGVVCVGAAVEFCTGKTATDVTDLFSSLCLTHSGTDTVRQPLCVGDKLPNTPISARCTETAMRICDATPLDPLCDGVEGYFSAQLDACVLNSNNPSCLVGSPTQFAALEPIAACLATPFDADCLNVATTQGMLFAPRAEAAQDAYCESGGARTTSTTVETTVDHVNCTNIGSLPVYADLARNITKNGIRTFNSDGSMVTANPVSGDNPNMGGFLRTGVFGTKLGDHAGTTSGTFTDENNNGNFDRGNDLGGAWLGLPTQPGSSLAPLGRGGDSDRIWDAASTTDPNDGFTYFIVDHDYEDVPGRDNDFFAYAGIWQTTNFGAPLAAPVGNAPTSAIWQGIFTPFSDKSIVETVASLTEIAQINREAINTRTTNFYVDFTNGTFNIHNPAGTDAQNPNGTDPTTGAVLGYIFGVGVGDEAVISKRIRYSVNGVFGAGIADLNNPGRMLNAGELGGNVTRSVEAATYAPDDTLTFGTDASPLVMPLTGLIGVEGALGIFVDPAVTTSPNVGGFTAAPTPAE